MGPKFERSSLSLKELVTLGVQMVTFFPKPSRPNYNLLSIYQLRQYCEHSYIQYIKHDLNTKLITVMVVKLELSY